MCQADKLTHRLLARHRALADAHDPPLSVEQGQLGLGNRVQGAALIGIRPAPVDDQRDRRCVRGTRACSQARDHFRCVHDVTVGKEEAAWQVIGGAQQ